MTKRVLVTGGAGFIGSHMAERLLALGHDVVILDNESTGSVDNVPAGAAYIKGDVREPADLARAFARRLDAVFHIAGQASTVRSFDDPLADLAINVGGTVNVTQHCLAHGVPRLLFASSMTAYGHPAGLPVSEETACVPVSYYGITKYAAERYVHATGARTDLAQPLHVTSFRMFNVYGPRQRLDNPYQGVMGIFIGNVLREEPVNIFGDGEQSRDFVYIDDVVNAWVTAWQSPAAHGQVFNLGIGQGHSVHAVVQTVAAALGHGPAAWPRQYGPERPGDQRHMTADVSHIRRTLGWEPQVSFAEGVARTIAWARSTI